ncbi:histone deacetylase family protein [Massilia sp. G4R7]|uniref:Histone deacetylase family protein n=1 Tax=Massilia phyllostachyos TaxID=2898585 RepID=A0ABS8Q7K2_9BURK|nr:histone deacetylase family protein [Massilia phyllostachyos]
MLTFYNEHHALAASLHAAALAPLLSALERRGLGRIVTPHGVPLVSLERVHSPRYLHFLRTAWSEWLALDPGNAGRELLPGSWPVRGMRDDVEPPDLRARAGLYASDTRTPLTAGAWTAAKTGADCAVNAAHALRMGERGSFALTLPPGRHVGADWCGGGGFLNNAALAAQHLLDDGLQRVAILDLGPHHGHGTQHIFYARGDVLFASLHLDPQHAWPWYAGHAIETGAGAGLHHTLNLPLAAGLGAAQWFAALETGCVKLGMFRPEALVVSLGAELAAHFALAGADFLRLGERIAHLGLPTVFVFEGADRAGGTEYATHLVNVLEGFETAA